MEEKMIFARAQPESIRLTETYYYEKIISRNPSTQLGQTPVGRIEITVPYDGYQYFTRQAYSDVKHQLGAQTPSGNVTALIGHLAFANHGRTNLKEVSNLSDRYGSAPLCVPILGEAITSMDRLYSDQQACLIAFDYTPQWPDTIPLDIDLSLWDEDTLTLPSVELTSEEGRRGLGDIVTQIAQQVNFRRNLLINSQIKISLPRDVVSEETKPQVVRMGLGWPTITSFRALHLGIGAIPSGKESPVIFNPLTRSLEWANVAMEAGTQSAGTDVQSYLTGRMRLLIDHPGELFQQSILNGRVEVEIPGQLLSGLQVRLFDGIGARARDFEPTISTRIILKFQLVLDEAFAKRTLSPYQHLHFDEVIPDEMRIADIKTALVDRGFRISQDMALPSRNELRHFILAERSEGPDTMELWVFIEGKHYQTERQTQVPGGQTFKSTFESGDIKVYVRGEMPGNSRRLIQEMNAFQTALRDRFERLKAKR